MTAKKTAPEPTIAETIMLTALLAIARDKPGCQGCSWDEPCPVCFASNLVVQMLEWPQFARWKKDWKITAVRRKKPK